MCPLGCPSQGAPVCQSCAGVFIIIIIKIFIYLFERETAQAGKGQREREREFRAGSALSEQSLKWGSISQP